MCAGYTSSSKLIAFDDYAYSMDSEETLNRKYDITSRVDEGTIHRIAPALVTQAACDDVRCWVAVLSLSGRYNGFDAQISVGVSTLNA